MSERDVRQHGDRMSDHGPDDPTQAIPPSGDGDDGGQPADGEGLWLPIPGQPGIPGEHSDDATSSLTPADTDPAWSMTKPEAADPTQILPGAAQEPPANGPPPGPDPVDNWDRPDETAIAPAALGLGAAGAAGGGFGGGDDGYGGDDGFGPPGEPIEPEEPVPWYRERGPVAALVAGVLALIMIIIAVFVLTGDGDDTDSIDPAPDSSSTTSDPTTTTRKRRTDPATSPPTAPPTTTTMPVTTTTARQTTTTARPTTTTAPPTTTTAPATTTTAEVVIPPQEDPTVWDILGASPDLSKARDYVKQAGLRKLLDDTDAPVTFLAPTNDAFELVEESPGGSDLLNDDERLRELLERHIIDGRVLSDDLFADEELETIGGDVLEVDPDNETIEDAIVLTADVEEGNGVVHAIDRVLLP
ncbi:hypothetical protein BH20ACT4_BH20ACT4_10840 [soil metagenome]